MSQISLESEVATCRPLAFAIAYRMLGSVAEAEDIVQEAFLRLHQTRQSPGRGRTTDNFSPRPRSLWASYRARCDQ